jgi:hypothetical protein
MKLSFEWSCISCASFWVRVPRRSTFSGVFPQVLIATLVDFNMDGISHAGTSNIFSDVGLKWDLNLHFRCLVRWSPLNRNSFYGVVKDKLGQPEFSFVLKP